MLFGRKRQASRDADDTGVSIEASRSFFPIELHLDSDGIPWHVFKDFWWHKNMDFMFMQSSKPEQNALGYLDANRQMIVDSFDISRASSWKTYTSSRSPVYWNDSKQKV